MFVESGPYRSYCNCYLCLTSRWVYIRICDIKIVTPRHNIRMTVGLEEICYINSKLVFYQDGRVCRTSYNLLTDKLDVPAKTSSENKR